ncbi:ABC transporter permease [Danxiaibacter flavus]|uniref:ABC transporter permease n=1 Tax=Danxiaibacter flavus TaxID=3049108 RepID=A0ABV3ZK21_9BACT|nr:ABC transporter permease [Chitinophagaceae bacterium DXS]
MLKNYAKIILRNMWRFKSYTCINLFGLALGMAVCLLVFMFVRFQKGYDKKYGNHISRLCTIQAENNESGPQKIAKTFFPTGPALKNEVPGIKAYMRIITWDKVPLQKADRTGTMATLVGADSNFFEFWNLHLVKGNESFALQEPGSIVLSASLARRLFGSASPIGMRVDHEGRDTQHFTVTGILPDVITQSHLQFDAVYSASTDIKPEWNANWTQPWVFTYLKLEDNAALSTIENKLPGFIHRHVKSTSSPAPQLFLQPLEDVHLRSGDIHYDAINSDRFDGSYLPLLSLVGLFVMLLAVVNYVNLNTARLFTRVKEVGIRKAIGATHREILLRFFCETIVFALLACSLALLCSFLITPSLNNLIGQQIDFSVFSIPQWIFIALIAILGTGIVAGIIPALAIAGIDVIGALKGKFSVKYHSPFRNVLVVLQFSIATCLLLGSIVILRQLQFMREYNLGFDQRAVIVVPVSYADRQKEENLMQILRELPGVTGVTGALRRLGSTTDQNELVFSLNNGSAKLSSYNMFVDFNYLTFYKIRFLAGRDFSKEFGDDRNGRSYIINKTLANKLMSYNSTDTSISSLVGKGLRYGFEDSLGTIIGVVDDFNFGSLHQAVEPLCLSYQYEYYFPELSLRLDMHEMSRTLTLIETEWKRNLPGQEFSWKFLDDHLQGLYKSDKQMGRLISIFAVVAIIISVMGLAGVTAFVTERRTKEIGIRKLLGASVKNILLLLSKEMIALVLLSIAIAMPLTWWGIHLWLQEFAFRVQIEWSMFVLVAGAVLLLAALTINLQVIRAASANPVNSLREE